MTTTDVLSDRELDAFLAGHLFGLVKCSNPKAHGAIAGSWPADNCHADPLSPEDGGEDPLYSSTGDGMLLVLEALREKPHSVREAFGNAIGEGLGIDPWETYTIADVGMYALGLTPRIVAEAARAALLASPDEAR